MTQERLAYEFFVKKACEYIKTDDKNSLETLIEKEGTSFICEDLYIECGNSLAINCLDYLLSKRSNEQIKTDKNFISLCKAEAAKGNNYDGRLFWKSSGKRSAPTPPPDKYKLPWGCTITENVYLKAFENISNNKSKAIEFIRYLMMNEFPIGDNLYYTIFNISALDGYVSMLYRFFIEKFEVYKSKVKHNFRQSLKGA